MFRPIKVGNRFIGGGSPVFIVAEVGINHNGSVAMAKKMIDIAVRCGVDAVKFQAFRAEEFISDRTKTYTYRSQGKWVTESMYKMFRRYELSEKNFRELFRYCKRKKILGFATPQNVTDLRMLLRLGVPLLKVGSDDLTNLPLMRAYALHKLPLIISAGMATLGEIEDAVTAIRQAGNEKFIILHCVSSYPACPEEVHLRKIVTLRQAFQVEVGFSDHTRGMVAALGAVAMGACIIEKHFTLDKNLLGPDHWFSANPKELKTFVEGVRYIEQALGSPIVGYSELEGKMRKIARRSLVAAWDIAKGRRLTPEAIECKRPGTGLPPKFLDFVAGRKAARDIRKGDLITLSNIC